MGLFDNLRRQAGSQFIEILEWLDDTGGALVYRFPVYNQEIKMGAMLTVRENQAALFVNEGRAADLFGPGLHELSTRNTPILTTLRGWKHGFKSPFKAEVYFFSTQLFTDLKWGTSQPVMMRDAELGMIRLRSFGTYALKIRDPKQLFSALVGTRGLTTSDEVTGQLRSIILSRFSDALAESKISALDLASRYDELSALARERIAPEFNGLGLDLARFYVESITLPEEVLAALDQRSRLGVMGDRLGEYTRLQAAEALTIAAGAPGGAAGAGVGLGAGMAIGQAFTAPRPAQGPPESVAPPPPAAAAAARWSLTIGGINYGPYTDQAIADMVRAGRLDPTTLAWRPGASGWAPLGTYAEFSGLTTPPPAPPKA